MGVDREPDEDGRTDNRRPDEKILCYLLLHKKTSFSITYIIPQNYTIIHHDFIEE